VFLIRSPPLIFILGNFILRINKSDEELNKLKRRDSIRTLDLVFLDKKFIERIDYDFPMKIELAPY
jgi:hypothetical protein